MGHGKTLTTKLLANGLPALLILSTVGGLSFGTALLVAVAITLLAYVLGDMMILPSAGNTVATVADAGLALVTLYLLRGFGLDVTNAGIWWTVIALGLVEGLFFHPYLQRLAGLDSMGPRIKGDGM